MEVHQPHHPTHKKKWTGYLLEFVMLFLAVFLGFMAENKREHMINGKKEKNYMRSMVEDLQMDTAILNKIIQRAEGVMSRLDTTTQILLTGNFNDSLVKKLYRLNLPMLTSIQILLTDRTSSQLKNAGGLNLIHNRAVVKALFEYWTSAREVENNAENYNDLRTLTREKTYSIFSAKYYSTMTGANRFAENSNPILMTTDTFFLTELANRLNHLKNSNQFIYIPNMKRVFSRAVELIKLIRKEYHLKE